MTNVNQQAVRTIPPEILAKAAKVGEASGLCEVRLVSQEVRLGPLEGITVSRIGHQCRVMRDAQNSKGVVEAAFAFELLKDKDTEPQTFIRAVFALGFNVNELDSFSDDEIQAFGEVTGSVISYPFFRELLYSTLSRMGLPPIVLPSFRIAADKADASSATVRDPIASQQPS